MEVASEKTKPIVATSTPAWGERLLTPSHGYFARDPECTGGTPEPRSRAGTHDLRRNALRRHYKRNLRTKQSQFVSLSPGTRLCDLCASVVSPARSSEWERS